MVIWLVHIRLTSFYFVSVSNLSTLITVGQLLAVNEWIHVWAICYSCPFVPPFHYSVSFSFRSQSYLKIYQYNEVVFLQALCWPIVFFMVKVENISIWNFNSSTIHVYIFHFPLNWFKVMSLCLGEIIHFSECALENNSENMGLNFTPIESIALPKTRSICIFAIVH